jgi:hypothetical protein
LRDDGREVGLTAPQPPPPRSPREEEEFLDWSENQARSRRSLLGVDLALFVLLLLVAVLVAVAVMGWLGGGHR